MNTSESIDAIILAGGAGIRLRQAVPNLQKVVAPVCGQPFLAHILSFLASEKKTRRVILALGWQSNQVVDALYHLLPSGIEIVFSTEDVPLGTGGATRQAFDYINGERALVMNGDSWTHFSIEILLQTHLKYAALATMLVTSVQSISRFGSVLLNEDGWISGFAEKKLDGIGFINAGAYILERRAVQKLPNRNVSSLEYDLFPFLVAEGLLQSYIVNGAFIDIGTAESYASANEFFTKIGGI